MGFPPHLLGKDAAINFEIIDPNIEYISICFKCMQN